MTVGSKIGWTDNTFNTWWGCARVSPGCRFCYADRDSARFRPGLWRRSGPRHFMSEGYWRAPLTWNRKAKRVGEPTKVFCGSYCDVFEQHPVAEIAEQQDAARTRLFQLIEATPWLIWQLLTKRPENVATMAPWGADWPRNVWLGTSVEDQTRADQRIPILLQVPAHLRFLSCEPLLGEVDLSRWLGARKANRDGTAGELHWIITGGESGPKAAPMHPGWAAGIRNQAVAAGVPFFHKQNGEYLDGGPVYTDGESESDFAEELLELIGAGCALELDGSRPVRWTARTTTVTAVPTTSAWWMTRVGRKAAGDKLNGQLWNQFPAGPAKLPWARAAKTR